MPGPGGLTAIELERRAVRVRDRAAGLVIAVPAWAWLSLLVGVSVVIRSVLAVRDPSPWIFQDELLFSELAKSFAASGHFAIRESPGAGGFGLVYPVLISPAWALFQKVPTAYAVAKGINAFLMSLAAVPVYLLTRRLAGRGLALGAAVLALALPSMVYTSTIMTENAFYPVFLFWVLAVVLALERPTVLRQLVAVGLTFLAYETRNQAAVLVPALVSAIVLLVLLEAWGDDRRFAVATARRAAAFMVTWATLAAGIAVFLIVEIGSKGKTVSNAVLGGYSILSESSYSVHEISRWFLYQLGELDLAVGVLPFAAFLMFVVVAFRRTPPSREARVFAVVTLSACFWLTLAVAAFSTTAYGHQLLERNLFYLEPLFLIALVAWAGGTLPRAAGPTGVAALIAATLAGVVPYDSFLTPNEVANAFGILPLWRAVLRGFVAPSHLSEVVILAALAAGLVFVLLPRRAALLAPAMVLAYFVFANSPIEGRTSQASSESRFGGVQVRRDWIDQAVGTTKPRVAAIWSGATNLNYVTLWDNEFFNRSVGPVYNLQGPPDGLPQETITIDPNNVLRHPNGTAVRAAYVLTDSSLQVAGRPIASDPGLGMTLYRVGGPLRVVRQTQGISPDKWSGPSVQYSRYPCSRGTLFVTLAGYGPLQRHPVTVVATSGTRKLGKIVVPPGARRTLNVPLSPERGFCLVNFSISPTVVPAQVLGNNDTRELGLRFTSLIYHPAR